MPDAATPAPPPLFRVRVYELAARLPGMPLRVTEELLVRDVHTDQRVRVLTYPDRSTVHYPITALAKWEVDPA